MNRRGFIKTQLIGGAALAAASSGLIRPGRLIAAPLPDLAVVRGKRAAAVKAAVDSLGGMARFVKPGQRVVIKPNMSFASPPEAATNTHPEVVVQLVRMCQEAGASRVLVLDNSLAWVGNSLESSGILEAVEKINPGSVHDISLERHFTAQAIKSHKAMAQTEVMNQVVKSDVLIAAPQAKSHSSTGVSLSMKGMMGLIHNRRVMHSRYDLDESIVDLAGLLKADLVVVDGSRVLTSGGPQGPGKVIEPMTIIASTDMVAADAMAVSMFPWYGKRYQPRQVRHIALAHQRGLGRMDIDKLNVAKIEL